MGYIMGKKCPDLKFADIHFQEQWAYGYDDEEEERAV